MEEEGRYLLWPMGELSHVHYFPHLLSSPPLCVGRDSQVESDQISLISFPSPISSFSHLWPNWY